MTMREMIDDYATNMGIELIVFDGLDEAIIGLAASFNTYSVAYSEEKILEILMREPDMTHEDAIEHFGFNIQGSYLGEGTPTIVKLDLN